MKYVNKMTGASIDISCSLYSDIWEPVLEKEQVPVVVEEKAEEKPVKKSLKKTNK